jgi:beta-N-acetylhexosaminidase
MVEEIFTSASHSFHLRFPGRSYAVSILASFVTSTRRTTMEKKLQERNLSGRRWLKAGLSAISVWVALAALLFGVVFYFKHPSSYTWRGLETPGLVLAACVGAWFARRAQRNASGWWRKLEAGLRFTGFLLLLGLTAGQEAWFRWQQHQVLEESASMRLMGRHFVVGFRNFEELKPLAKGGLIGGIYITSRNLSGETASSLRAKIDELQSLRRDAGLPPLFVMADQEGGKVSHLSPMLEHMPGLATLVADGQEGLEERARAYGQQQGRALAAVGVNMNLSPVVDLKIKQKGAWINLYTQIERRAIDSDPAVVTKVASAYSEGLLANGILPTVKHFPGLGRIQGDTHLVKTSLKSEPAERAADWMPFREVTAQTGAAMMLGHVHLPDIDPKWPASASRALVQDVLRKADGWNFQGILITDDLNMGAVYADGIDRTAISGLNAGVDLLLVSSDLDQYYRALYAVARMWRAGGIDTDRELASAKRLDKYWEDRDSTSSARLASLSQTEGK